MAERKQPRPSLGALTAFANAGFRRAYTQVRVDEHKYLKHVQRAHKLPVESWPQMLHLEPEVIAPIAESTISASSKLAALEGAGFGIGAFLTVVPDMGALATITLRTLQKLSLLHGFEYSTEADNIQLWIAAATAAGVDLGRDFLGKQAAEQLVPRIIDRIAMRVGEDVAEKWAGRLIPVVGMAAGAAINYYFVRAWGRRAQAHFAKRHRAVRKRLEVPSAPSPSSAVALYGGQA
ncbi:MAG: EcsC family protein [Candidatus Acidiferrales bacterium]